MSTRGLVQLEDQRRDEVERASRALSVLRNTHEQALEAQRVAEAPHQAALGARRAAGESFATARSVRALQAAEAALCVAKNALVHARERVERCAAHVHATAQAVVAGEETLRVGEVARRSVARTLEQRAADVSVRTERRHEDESDDAFRAQFYARTPVSSLRRRGR